MQKPVNSEIESIMKILTEGISETSINLLNKARSSLVPDTSKSALGSSPLHGDPTKPFSVKELGKSVPRNIGKLGTYSAVQSGTDALLNTLGLHGTEKENNFGYSDIAREGISDTLGLVGSQAIPAALAASGGAAGAGAAAGAAAMAALPTAAGMGMYYGARALGKSLGTDDGKNLVDVNLSYNPLKWVSSPLLKDVLATNPEKTKDEDATLWGSLGTKISKEKVGDEILKGIGMAIAPETTMAAQTKHTQNAEAQELAATAAKYPIEAEKMQDPRNFPELIRNGSMTQEQADKITKEQNNKMKTVKDIINNSDKFSPVNEQRIAVNNEIDLIRSIYSKSSELILEAKAKKLTPKEPDLYSGIPAPAPAVKPKTTKGKSKPAAKAKPAVSEPTPDTTSERVNIDPMTKKQGNAVFAKPKASVSPAVSSIPTPTLGSSADIINPGIRINPKRLSSVQTASDIVNRQQPVGSTISTAATKYGDLNKDGMVSKAETELVPASVSAPVAAPIAASTPSTAYKFGQGLRNTLTSPKTISMAGAAILGTAAFLGRNIGMPQQTLANKPVTPITAQSDTPDTSSSFEAPPDPGQRRWTPYNYFTNPNRVSPVNEQQEITEYYRQVLTQKLEEASAKFWAGRAGATRKEVEAAESSERFNILAPFKAMEPNKYPVKNMPVKDKKETVESEPLKREDRFQFPNDPVTRNEFTLGRLATATSAPSGPKIQQPLIPSSMLQGLEGRMKAAGQWLAGETTETTLPSGETKQVRRGAPLLDSDKRAATEIKNKLMAMKSRRAQPTTQAPKETFDAEGVDMTVELPKLPTISGSRQSQIGINLERELDRVHGTVEEPKSHAGDDIDDDTAIDTELPSIASHAKREDAAVQGNSHPSVLQRLYPASSRVSPVGDIAPISAENPPSNMSLSQLKIDAKAAKQRKSHAALHDIYGSVFNRHSGSATPPDQAEPNFAGRNYAEPVSTGRTDVSSTNSWAQLVAQQLSPHKYSVVNPVTDKITEKPVRTPFKDEHTPKGRLRKTPLHPVRQALNQVRLSEPHTFAALLPHVDDATKTSLQQHMDYLAKNSARDVETPKSDVGTLLKNISRF